MSTKQARAGALVTLADEPPPTFVARRKALASERTSEGDTAGARALLARRRPTWTAWALGRLARGDVAALEQTFAAHEALARAVKAGEKIAAAQTQFSRALEAAGRAAREEMTAAGHAGAAGEARRVRAALRAIAEQGQGALAALASGDFHELVDDAGEAGSDTANDGTPEDGGFLAAAKASLGRKGAAPSAASAKSRARAEAAAKAEASRSRKAREEQARREAQAATERDKARRAKAAELARAEKAAFRAAARVAALESELAAAIDTRTEQERHVKELRAARDALG